MADLVVVEHVTLDGIMQGPGRPDEDTRDGFTEGGWAAQYMDAVAMEQSGRGMASASALLLGRRTYLDFHAHWTKQADGNPFTDSLNRSRKYVVSRTLTSTPWENSTVLSGVDEVAAVKERLTGDLVVLGSGALVASLGALVDRYVLSINPVALGTGRRLVLPAGGLDLVGTVTTGTGVIIATYARTTS
jgi:dihydrofolate reductase